MNVLQGVRWSERQQRSLMIRRSNEFRCYACEAILSSGDVETEIYECHIGKYIVTEVTVMANIWIRVSAITKLQVQPIRHSS